MLLSLYININIFISLQQGEGQSVMNQEGFQEGMKMKQPSLSVLLSPEG